MHADNELTNLTCCRSLYAENHKHKFGLVKIKVCHLHNKPLPCTKKQVFHLYVANFSHKCVNKYDMYDKLKVEDKSNVDHV